MIKIKLSRVLNADLFSGGINRLVSLKKKSSNGLKILFAIGGQNQPASVFSQVFASETKRLLFVKSCLDFVEKYGFDGINIDWHFPRDDLERNDRLNFVRVLNLMRAWFKRYAQRKNTEQLLLTITIPEKPSDVRGFDIPELDKAVDFFCLTSYNYHTSDERSAHHHSPLFKNKNTQACFDTLDLDANSSVSLYIKKGITISKLILGIPLFGRCYNLEDEDHHKIGSATSGPCYKSKWEYRPSYHEICKKIQDKIWIQRGNASCNIGPYAIRKERSITSWISFDDKSIIKEKAFYASNKGLGGLSFWSVTEDDYDGRCGERYSLIKASISALTNTDRNCRNDAILHNFSLNETTRVKSKNDSINQQRIDTNSLSTNGTNYNPYRLKSGNIYTGIWGILNISIGIVGNTLTIVAIPYAVYRRKYRLHTAWISSTIFIVNLAVSDLAYCIFGMPHEILLHLGIGWPFGDNSCKFFNLFAPIFAYDNWYALGLIALTRAFNIIKPHAWKSFCTKKNVMLLILSTKLLNLILCLARLLPDGKEFVKNEYTGLCQSIPKRSLHFHNPPEPLSGHLSTNRLQMAPHYIAFFATLTVITTSYFAIWKFIRNTKKKVNDTVKTAAQGHSRQELRLTVTFAIICILFFVCVLPLTMIELLGGKIGYDVIISLYWTQYCVNVLVYAARRDEFLKAYLDVLDFCGCSKMVNWSKRNIKFNMQFSTQSSHAPKDPTSNSVEFNSLVLRSLGTSFQPSTKNDSKRQISEKVRKFENKKGKVLCLLDVLVLSLIVSLFIMMGLTQTKPKNLLILGGYTSQGPQNVCLGWLDDVDLIDLEKSALCSEGPVQFTSQFRPQEDAVEHLPKRLTDASGQIFQNYPTICGGKDENWKTLKSCYKMVDRNNWKRIADLNIERSKFSSSANKNGLFVAGGQDGSGKFRNELEFLSTLKSFKFENKAKIPNEGLVGSCMVSLDENTLFLVGGFLPGFRVTQNAWSYDFNTNRWIGAKPMQIGRAHHSCSLVKREIDEDFKIMVVGGSIDNGGSTNTVEIYDPKKKVWETGPQLPIPVVYSQLIEDEIRGGVLLIGGRTSDSGGSIVRLSDIYHLGHDMTDWKKLGRKMKIERESHVALMLPENINRCEE